MKMCYTSLSAVVDKKIYNFTALIGARQILALKGKGIVSTAMS
jgi:hypothetical protein